MPLIKCKPRYQILQNSEVIEESEYKNVAEDMLKCFKKEYKGQGPFKLRKKC